MYRDDQNLTETIVSSLFLGGMFFLSYLSGKNDAHREIEEKKQKEDIEYLKWKVNNKNY